MAKGRKGRRNPDNRIRPLLNKLSGAENADDIMNELIVVLSDSQVQVPQAGAYYVFQYFAITPELLYDRFPIVACTGVYEWGITGINRHINEPRNYNFNQFATPMYQIKNVELQSALTLPLRRLIQN